MRAHAPRPALACAGALLLTALLAGCGGSADDDATAAEGPASSEEPDEATLGCRAQWRDLRDDAAELREEGAAANDPDTSAPPPSTLPSRWSSVEATLAYYVGAAVPADCGETLAAQREELRAFADFAASLRPYDMELRAIELGVTGGTEVDLPEGDGVPPRRRLERAVQTLRDDAASATADQAPAWQQAQVVDLADDEARQQAVDDLELLSEESAAWRRCRQAARLLERVLED